MSRLTNMYNLATGVAAVFVTFSLGVTSASADSFTVYTGYADNLRPSGFFPTPWLDSPGVVSQTPFGQSSDSGAIRFDDTGSTAITISNFTETQNGGAGPVYAIWTSLTLNPGQTGIFTQTVSYNFDTSDDSTTGPAGGISGGDPGSNGIGGCSSTAAAQATAGITAYCAGRQPILTFDVNGNPFTLNDTGHIIDSGNYDFINGSTDGNESINWNLIGSEADRGGTAPEPSTWTMMMLGFAGLGLMARRRARRTALTV